MLQIYQWHNFLNWIWSDITAICHSPNKMGFLVSGPLVWNGLNKDISIHTLQSLPRTHFFLGHGFLRHLEVEFRAQTFQTSSFCDKLYRKTIFNILVFILKLIERKEVEFLKLTQSYLHAIACVVKTMTFGLPQTVTSSQGIPTSPQQSNAKSRAPLISAAGFSRQNPRGSASWLWCLMVVQSGHLYTGCT